MAGDDTRRRRRPVFHAGKISGIHGRHETTAPVYPGLILSSLSENRPGRPCWHVTPRILAFGTHDSLAVIAYCIVESILIHESAHSFIQWFRIKTFRNGKIPPDALIDMNSKKPAALLLTSTLAGGAAHGAIVYTNFNNLVFNNYNGTTNFDLTSSFDSQYSLLYQDQNVQKPQISGDGTGSFVLARTWTDTNNMDPNFRTYGGLPIDPGGVLVGPSAVDVNAGRQANGVTNLTVQVNGYFNDRPIATDGTTGGNDHWNYLGDWGQGGTSSGYVGLVMVNGGVTNYGWAHFSWSDPSTSYSSSSTLTLIDAAYQSTANAGILTGDGTPGAPVISGVTSSAPSETNYAGASIELAANVTGGLTYQWKAGAVGGGVYTNLSDNANISGSQTANLIINSAGVGNTADYVVVASNNSGDGSTTSAPTTVTVLSAGVAPASGTGWNQSFQGQTDFTYAGGRQNVGYLASNGKVYWLVNQLAAGLMNPVDDSFSTSVETVDNRILSENGDYRVTTATLPLDGTNAVPENPNENYQLRDLFEANGLLYAVCLRVNTSNPLQTLGAELAVFKMLPGGALQFLRWVQEYGTGTSPTANTPSTIQWASSAVVQNGLVYIFGYGSVTNTDGNTVQDEYLARSATSNVTYSNLWTFWNGSSWDPNEVDAAPISTNTFAVVRYYKGNWVAIDKPGDVNATDTYAYTSTQPQGPYSSQDLFTDPTNAVEDSGLVTNPANGEEFAYYTDNPTPHPELSLTSGALLVSIDYEDGFSYTYDTGDAELYKPRYYEVTLTNLVFSSSLQIWRAGNNVVVIWPSGTLEQATNLLGPWTTNTAASPYTNTPAGKQLFFRTIQ
jgi:hypothetical protein